MRRDWPRGSSTLRRKVAASSSTTSVHFGSNIPRAAGRSTAISASSSSGFSPQTAAALPSTHCSTPSCGASLACDTRQRRRIRTCWRSVFRPGRAAGRRRPSRCRKMSGAADDSPAKCTTTTPRRSAVSRDTPACSARLAAVGEFARSMLRAARGDAAVPAPLTPALVTRATRKTTVPGSSRALGWDTMLPTSSCGTKLSPSAFGHARFYRDVAVDRSRARSLLRAAHQPRVRRRHRGRDQSRYAARFTMRLPLSEPAARPRRSSYLPERSAAARARRHGRGWSALSPARVEYRRAARSSIAADRSALRIAALRNAG